MFEYPESALSDAEQLRIWNYWISVTDAMEWRNTRNLLSSCDAQLY